MTVPFTAAIDEFSEAVGFDFGGNEVDARPSASTPSG